MKYIFTALLVLLYSSAFNQENQTYTEDYLHYEDVVELPENSKSEIYIAVKKWVALYYKSAQAVIQLDDKESGELIIKGISVGIPFMKSFGAQYYNDVSHTISISIKENKIRIICDFKTLMVKATSGTTIGRSYTSGTSAHENDLRPIVNGSRPGYRKKDRETLKQGLINEFKSIRISIIENIKNPKNSEW